MDAHGFLFIVDTQYRSMFWASCFRWVQVVHAFNNTRGHVAVYSFIRESLSWNGLNRFQKCAL